MTKNQWLEEMQTSFSFVATGHYGEDVKIYQKYMSMLWVDFVPTLV